MNETEYSKNERAEKLLGKRKGGGTPIFLPIELGYVCPICNQPSEGLEFSEYNGFLWCDECNVDIPSCLCVKNSEEKFLKPLSKKEAIKRATKIFLDTVEDTRLR